MTITKDRYLELPGQLTNKGNDKQTKYKRLCKKIIIVNLGQGHSDEKPTTIELQKYCMVVDSFYQTNIRNNKNQTNHQRNLPFDDNDDDGNNGDDDDDDSGAVRKPTLPTHRSWTTPS